MIDDSKIIADALVQIKRHLPRGDDLTLIVLKGHLLVEEQINGLIGDNVIDEKPLERARLTFAQRIALVRALVPPSRVSSLKLDATEKLNSLRNELAHNLSSEKIEKKVIRFLESIEDSDVKELPFRRHTPERLRFGIVTLCATLTGQRVAALTEAGASAEPNNA
ncbi:hypothetical protein [Wenzhouxiangella sp. EGI_FJ10409]|uniref:hypothetical protein n=1 Tax=Wenzhouxiangella sp. EGI_FJ10409 TaxID=3243767 RepID=UPI0035D94F6F